VSNKCPTRN